MKIITAFTLITSVLSNVNVNNFNVKELVDGTNENKFILKEHENSYEIYQKINGTLYFSESSNYANSPYFNIKSDDLYYLGPGNYFYKKNNLFYNIKTNEVFENLNYTYSLNLNNNENEIELTSYTDVEIKNSNFLRNMKYVPSNENGDCGMVAISILLSYFDTFYDDRFLQDYTFVRPSINLTPTSLSSWSNSPYVTTRYKNILKTNYGHRINITDQYPMADKEIYDTIYSYLNDINDTSLLNLITLDHNSTFSLNIKNRIKNHINNNEPAILTLLSYDPIDDMNSNAAHKYHDVITYGYGDNYFLCHMGYQNDAAIKISTSSSIYSYCAMSYNGNHAIHSKNFIYNNGETENYYCGCFGYEN